MLTYLQNLQQQENYKVKMLVPSQKKKKERKNQFVGFF